MRARSSLPAAAAESPFWNRVKSFTEPVRSSKKDLISGKLAEMLDADELLILTSVEKVSLNYKSDTEQYLDHITTAQARQYMSEDQFEPSTMLPKIEASVNFVEKKKGRRAVITSIEKAKPAYLAKPAPS